METWEQFRCVIQAWARLEVTDATFYAYLTDTVFEDTADRRLADIFIKQHDGGEWSHAIYHRM
jgi:hypothetical protein